MKSYNDFLEAVSARRLAQLRAKGKGPAVDRKMAADKLVSAPKPQGQNEKARRLRQGRAGQNKGGALAIRPKSQTGNLTRTARNIARDKAVNMVGNFVKKKINQPPAGKGGALARGKNYKAPNQRDDSGFKRTTTKDKGYMTSPDTRISKPRTLSEPTGGDLGSKRNKLTPPDDNSKSKNTTNQSTDDKKKGKSLLKRANNLRKKIKLNVPSSEISYSPGEGVDGPKKFGKSAS